MKKLKQLISAVIACASIVALMQLPVSAEGTTTVRIAHTNDLHGYYTATDKGNIGFAYLKSIIDETGADLVLDAGDTFHGQVFATIENGMGMAELMKAVGYDATTPGNHDWNYGAARLKELEEAGGFSILASNVVNEDGSAYFDTPYLVKTVTADDGTEVKVGVLGVIDDILETSTLTENIAGLDFLEEAASASETARILKEDEGCDLVIALTHQNDCEGFVGAISNIDAVIAGHQHIAINESYPDSEGKSVAVVEAGCYFYGVGILELTLDPETKEVTNTLETVYTAAEASALTENETVKEKISAIEAREMSVLSEVVTESDTEYPYSREDLRLSEQPTGRIVTAAYLETTGADVAMENAGGIRAGIPSGTVTSGNVIGILPFGNTLVTKALTGKQILDIVEYSLEINRACAEVYAIQLEAFNNGEDPYQYEWPDNDSSAIQFGGIKLTYDMTKPEGSRVTDAEIGGEAVDPERLYTVATNVYVSENDEYSGMAEAALITEYGACDKSLKDFLASGNWKTAAVTENLSEAAAEEAEPEVADTAADVDETEPEAITEPEPTAETTAEEAEPTAEAPEEEAEAETAPKTGVEGLEIAVVVSLAAAGIMLVSRKSKSSRNH